MPHSRRLSIDPPLIPITCPRTLWTGPRIQGWFRAHALPLHNHGCAGGDARACWRPAAARPAPSRCGPCPRARWSRNSTSPPTADRSRASGPMQLLRVYNLSDDLERRLSALLKKLQAINDREPSADTVYALSELAFLGGEEDRAARQTGGAGSLRRVGPARLRLSVRRAFRRHAQPVRSAVPRRLRSVQRRAGIGACGSSAQRRNWCPARRKTINTAAGTWDITCVLQRRPLAAGGLRALRVRLRLRDEGAEEPLPDARTGRAADRRPPQLPGRAGRRRNTIRRA